MLSIPQAGVTTPSALTERPVKNRNSRSKGQLTSGAGHGLPAVLAKKQYGARNEYRFRESNSPTKENPKTRKGFSTEDEIPATKQKPKAGKDPIMKDQPQPLKTEAQKTEKIRVSHWPTDKEESISSLSNACSSSISSRKEDTASNNATTQNVIKKKQPFRRSRRYHKHQLIDLSLLSCALSRNPLQPAYRVLNIGLVTKPEAQQWAALGYRMLPSNSWSWPTRSSERSCAPPSPARPTPLGPLESKMDSDGATLKMFGEPFLEQLEGVQTAREHFHARQTLASLTVHAVGVVDEDALIAASRGGSKLLGQELREEAHKMLASDLELERKVMSEEREPGPPTSFEENVPAGPPSLTSATARRPKKSRCLRVNQQKRKANKRNKAASQVTESSDQRQSDDSFPATTHYMPSQRWSDGDKTFEGLSPTHSVYDHSAIGMVPHLRGGSA